MKVFRKACLVAFSSSSLKMIVWFAINLKKLFAKKNYFVVLKVSVLFGIKSEKNVYYCLIVIPESLSIG